MLACQIVIKVAYLDQPVIDQLISESNPFPYAERYRRCRGLLGAVNAWLEDQKKDKGFLRAEVEYVHVKEEFFYKSVMITVTDGLLFV